MSEATDTQDSTIGRPTERTGSAASHTYDQGYQKWETFGDSDDDDEQSGAPAGGPPDTDVDGISDDDSFDSASPSSATSQHTPKPEPEHALTEDDKAEMEDISGDGSLLKKIIKAGDGSGNKPKTGNSVKCHYTGRLLDGEKFDSSRDRDEPFGFKIGTGVITGWSEGVATMEIGETARFCIAAEKAYGELLLRFISALDARRFGLHCRVM